MTFKFKDLSGVPSNPPTGYVGIYNNGGVLYWIDSSGTTTSIASGAGDLKADGTIPLTADWDGGAFKITAEQLESDVADGTAPLIVTSTTQVDNLTSEWSSKALGVVTAVRNESSVTLSKGVPVYVSGYSVGSEIVLVDLADADNASAMPCVGLVLDDIANNASGYVVIGGLLADVDTSAFTSGDELYIDTTAGALTATRPTGATTEVQNVATVLRSHASNGVLKIQLHKPSGLPNLTTESVWYGGASNAPAEATVAEDQVVGRLTGESVKGLTATEVRTLINVEDGASAFDGTKYVGVNDQTGTAYELVLADAGKLVTMDNASANTLTIPANASVSFDLGTQIDVLQKGAGQTSIAITTDTLNGAVNINAQWEVVSLLKIAATEWVVVGGVA